MILTKKTKCAGCKALRVDKNTGYSCMLGFKMEFQSEEHSRKTIYYSPAPIEPCLKPATPEQLKNAKLMLERKSSKSA